MFFWALIALFVLLLAYNVVMYVSSTGTFVERLSAGWKGTSTIFVLVWTGFLGLVTNGTQALSDVTSDPRFAQAGEYIKNLLPPDKVPYFVLATLLLPILGGIAARLRTAGK